MKSTRFSDGWGKEINMSGFFSKSALKAIKRRLNKEHRTYFTCYLVNRRRDGTVKVIELPY